MNNYDFSGWATRNNVRCADGRTIMKDAFKDCDGSIVPLVWGHNHKDPDAVCGHALLENREEGVYMYGYLNETETGETAKKLIKHGDVTSLSIFANKLKHQGHNVTHGLIREVSLVLAGANPEAYIDTVMAHSEDGEIDECVIYAGEQDVPLYHSAVEEQQEEVKEMPEFEETLAHACGDPKKKKTELSHEAESAGEGKTVKEIYDTLSEEQKAAVEVIVGSIIEDQNGEEDNMKHNAFDSDMEYTEDTLCHADMEAVFSDAKRYGSLKDSTLAHGIEDIEWLFPDAKNLNTPPEFIKRDTGWVSTVMGGVHHTPFSRIKSMFADLREDDARALGYIKGNMKKDEVFGMLKRTTVPTTIYKKQKLDRDDVIDITDFDVVSWLKAEMRMMLDEEIARAILIGDGRSVSSDDKINEQNIRPIVKDEELFTIKKKVTVASTATDDERARAIIRAAIKARKDYKGSGEPTMFTTEDVLTDLLLIEDKNGRIIYDSVQKLCSAMRVSKIVTVPVMEGAKGVNNLDLLAIIVNLKDYNVGADKGGAVNMFDDFDIDYNAQKYLIETRCSGALIKPYSAIALELEVSGS